MKKKNCTIQNKMLGRLVRQWRFRIFHAES